MQMNKQFLLILGLMFLLVHCKKGTGENSDISAFWLPVDCFSLEWAAALVGSFFGGKMVNKCPRKVTWTSRNFWDQCTVDVSLIFVCFSGFMTLMCDFGVCNQHFSTWGHGCVFVECHAVVTVAFNGSPCYLPASKSCARLECSPTFQVSQYCDGKTVSWSFVTSLTLVRSSHTVVITGIRCQIGHLSLLAFWCMFVTKKTPKQWCDVTRL